MSTNEYVGKFYGPEKIVAIETIETTTPSGAAIYEVTLEKSIKDRTVTRTTLVTQKALDLAITDDGSISYTDMSANKLNAMGEGMLDVVKEFNLEFLELDALMQGFKQMIELHYQRALSFLFTGDRAQFIPGYDPKMDVTLLQTERIIAKITPEDAAA